MATITAVTAPHTEGTTLHYEVFKATWEAMGDDDTGSSVFLAGYADKTVQIAGTLGAGTVVLQGSNDANTWVTLTDADGSNISGVGMYYVRENPLYIRPVTASGSSNDIDVILVATRGVI